AVHCVDHRGTRGRVDVQGEQRRRVENDSHLRTVPLSVRLIAGPYMNRSVSSSDLGERAVDAGAGVENEWLGGDEVAAAAWWLHTSVGDQVMERGP
ncbi:MAG: hypothetical protein RJA47_1128, partial [Actinomycetota bacterium]